MKQIIGALLMVLVFGLCVSMVKHPTVANPTSNGVTQLVFWSANPNYGDIEVYVDGVYAGTIKQFYNGVPACFASGCVTAQNVGPYTQFNAKTTDGNTVWNTRTFPGITLGTCNSFQF